MVEDDVCWLGNLDFVVLLILINSFFVEVNLSVGPAFTVYSSLCALSIGTVALAL